MTRNAHGRQSCGLLAALSLGVALVAAVVAGLLLLPAGA